MRTNLIDVINAIKPTEEELDREIAFARFLVSHVQRNSPENCTAVLTGSMAKRTFLKDKRDIDIFVLFDCSVPRDSLEANIQSIMHASFPNVPYQLSYAEHPYIRFHFQGRRVDLVPAYKIGDSSERISAVDRSVLHTEFVIKMLKAPEEVLLLKQFLKANSLYGAEIKVKGFSGYLCELLIIKYGSFRALAKSASGWKLPLFIDLKGHYKKREDIREAVERFGDFVVIDPTDKNRNVAAAVSSENLKRFKSLCKNFSNNPSDDYFFRVPESFQDKVLKAAKKGPLYIISMPRPDIVDDVLWGQLYRLMDQLAHNLQEFGTLSIFAEDSKHIVKIALLLREDELPAKKLIQGPPLKMKEHVGEFRSRHRKSRFIKKKNKLWAEVRRIPNKADPSIRAFFRSFLNSHSHLAYPEEMIVVQRFPSKKKSI